MLFPGLLGHLLLLAHLLLHLKRKRNNMPVVETTTFYIYILLVILQELSKIILYILIIKLVCLLLECWKLFWSCNPPPSPKKSHSPHFKEQNLADWSLEAGNACFFLLSPYSLFYSDFFEGGLFEPENKTIGERLKQADSNTISWKGKKIHFIATMLLFTLTIHILIWLPPCQSGRARGWGAPSGRSF